MNPRLFAPMAALALSITLFVGCSPTEPEVEPATPAGAEAPEDAAAGEPTAAADVELTAEQIEVVNQLPPEDAEIALAQAVCPVSDEPLGSMGVPIKVDANGTPVFVCCAGCEDAVAADPDGMLARVPQGSAEAPTPEGEGS